MMVFRRHQINSYFSAARAALLAAALVAFALSGGPRAAEAAGGLVARDGDGFVLDGQPFAAVGVNCYYLMTRAASVDLRSEAREVLDKAKALGATVVRTWAFNDGADQWNALQPAPGAYSETVFIGLDYVVKEAGLRGLRLLLPLVNNWPDYGGMDRYVAWSDTASTHDDFYTDPSCRDWYKAHIRKVLTRVNTFTGVAYRDDPAIFGWELANEPRAQDKGAAVLDAWIAAMSEYLKTIDPRHLLSTGSEGFYGGATAGKNPASWMAQEGVDFLANHSHPAIDFGSFHVYADLWSVSKDQAVKFVRDHYADGRDVLGKPVLMGEFGKLQPIPLRNDYYEAYYREALGVLSPGHSRAGALLWILYGDSYKDYDGFGVYYPNPAHATTTDLISRTHQDVKARIAPPPPYIRADSNCDGRVDIADAIESLEFLFGANAGVCCDAALDANGDGPADISDPIYTLFFLFDGGKPPAAPYPACGREDPLRPEIICAKNASCFP
jgi:mannan endo-1,4-beta-mannosidase